MRLYSANMEPVGLNFAFQYSIGDASAYGEVETVDGDGALSILHWRCPLNALPRRHLRLDVLPFPFQYSIGDAYRMIDATEPFIGTFQYSIGDAVTESEALRAMIRFFFQYSIGDA